jgi:hypothetical protein
MTDGTARARLTLGVDLIAFALFIAVGMRSHHEGAAFEIFARNAIPIGGVWLVAGYAFGAYRPPSHAGLVKTLLVALPVGALLRTAWVGSPQGVRILLFAGVALLFSGLFLGTGRVLVSLATRTLEGSRA